MKVDEALAVSKQVPHHLRALDEIDFACTMEPEDGELSIDFGVFPMSKAAYQWSRKARKQFNYPTHSPSNKIIVADWLRKTMAAQHVRPGQMDILLPAAIMLTFVKSKVERDVAAMERVLLETGEIEVSRK